MSVVLYNSFNTIDQPDNGFIHEVFQNIIFDLKNLSSDEMKQLMIKKLEIAKNQAISIKNINYAVESKNKIISLEFYNSYDKYFAINFNSILLKVTYFPTWIESWIWSPISTVLKMDYSKKENSWSCSLLPWLIKNRLSKRATIVVTIQPFCCEGINNSRIFFPSTSITIH